MPKENWFKILGDDHNLAILSLLIDGRPRNLYTISRQSKIYPKTVRSHLKKLMRSEVIETESIGGITLYKIHRERFAEEILTFLRWLEARRT